VRLDAFRALMVAFVSLREQLSRELEEERGLPLAWYEVMLFLSQEPDHRMRITDLAKAVMLSKSGLSQLVSRMQAAGLLCREAYAEDRRGVYAMLTDRGRRVFRRAAPIHLRGIQEHFGSRLSEEEARTLRQLLEKISLACVEDAWEPPPCPEAPG
jgi:DNA-binding MarR family transcriptional regulator